MVNILPTLILTILMNLYYIGDFILTSVNLLRDIFEIKYFEMINFLKFQINLEYILFKELCY